MDPGVAPLLCACIPEDGFLDEQHVAASLLNLFHQVQDVSALLSQHTVHLGVV